jgi:hypothetical protein
MRKAAAKAWALVLHFFEASDLVAVNDEVPEFMT